jgi:hypothetical protein
MNEEKVKQAFSKIKEDILNLKSENKEIKSILDETNTLLRQLDQELVFLKLERMTRGISPNNHQADKQTDPSTYLSTHNHETSTHPVTSTHTSTVPQEIGGWKTRISDTSTRNEGVSTDRQTDKQTVRQTHFAPEIPPLVTTNPSKTLTNQPGVVTKDVEDSSVAKPINKQISEASEILDSLDDIKKDIRRKFKSITQQEMLVFSTIFAMEEAEDPDYYKVAQKLNLSQSSIRDYVQRMINKGIPIEKEKLNNKKIILHISPNLKKIASLNAIIKLRDL